VKLKKTFLIFFGLCMINSFVLGEEPLPESESSSPHIEAEADGSQTVYYIRNIDFDSTGRTRPFALLRMGEFRAGERITGKAALEDYISKKTQLLHNQRVLEEVRIDVSLWEAEENGLVPADLLIHTKDSWNIIGLPWGEYDSNTGLELSLKLRDYNFLGTMNPLRVDFGYKRDEHDKSSFFLKIDSDTPFKLFGYNWTLNFDNDFSYTYGEPFYYKNITGLSMDLPFKMTTLTFGAEQGFVLHEKNEDKDIIAEEGEFFPQTWYMYSELYTQWKIPLGITVGAFGELAYTPKLTGKINYRPGGEIGNARRGPQAALSHTLGFGRINWVGNFRSGMEVNLGNTNTFNFAKEEWTRDISAVVLGHLPISSFFGISGRMQYKYWLDKPYDKAGDVLRGIKNDTISAGAMVSLNMDFPLRAIHFVPSQWFNNPKLRFLDFEQHWVPFVDLALVKHPGEGLNFSSENIYATGGLELITYPYFMRSIYLRVSFGGNLKELFKTRTIPRGDNREIYIGLGHYY
jgi:hypothetical protein